MNRKSLPKVKEMQQNSGGGRSVGSWMIVLVPVAAFSLALTTESVSKLWEGIDTSLRMGRIKNSRFTVEFQ